MTVEMEEIPTNLVLNWDQTGLKIVPSSSWMMEKQAQKFIEIVGANDKREITAVFRGMILSDFLPLQVV